jgi:hypothetical protein
MCCLACISSEQLSKGHLSPLAHKVSLHLFLRKKQGSRAAQPLSLSDTRLTFGQLETLAFKQI